MLALEERPRGASELAADLDLRLDTVHWALKQLRKAGLVVVRQRGITTGSVAYGINETANSGWQGVLDALVLVVVAKKH